MANYYGVTRTNYFTVTNREKLEELVSNCVTDDLQGVQIYPSAENPNYVCLACYGDIEGILDEDEDPSFDSFVNELQKLIPDGEAVIIVDAGHEKLRCVRGGVCIITNKDWKYIDTHSIGITTARTLLGDPNWTSKCDY